MKSSKPSNNVCSDKNEESELNELVNKIPRDRLLYNMSEIIKAISDPLRLKILYLLKSGELCACHIDFALDKPQSTIAHHLSILKKANLLNWRKEGKWTYYSLSNPEIIELIEDITAEEVTNNNITGEEVTNNNITSEKVTSEKIASEKIADNTNTKLKIKDKVDDKFFKAFEDRTKDLDIFKVGYTKIETKNINNEIIHENVIVLAIEMDENIIKTSPGEKAKNLNKKFYDKFRKITKDLSGHIEIAGFKTQIAHPNEDLLDLPFLAQKAGLGHVGQSGLLITPEFGSQIKLSGILTSINDPIFDKSSNNNSINNHKWIKEHCKDCGECIENCESEALVKSAEKHITELSESKCIGSEEGCTYCIEKCPFNEKGYSLVKKEFLENYKKKI